MDTVSRKSVPTPEDLLKCRFLRPPGDATAAFTAPLNPPPPGGVHDVFTVRASDHDQVGVASLRPLLADEVIVVVALARQPGHLPPLRAGPRGGGGAGRATSGRPPTRRAVSGSHV